MTRSKSITLFDLEERVAKELEYIINSTPTGPVRNVLTELNLVLMATIEEVKKEEPVSIFDAEGRLKGIE